MKQVVIGLDKSGKPYVVHCPRKVEVIIRTDKHRSFRKVMRTVWYKLTH